ncbi:MAG: hypothetical protein WD904_05330 [Dehalococcoidia bacterium]
MSARTARLTSASSIAIALTVVILVLALSPSRREAVAQPAPSSDLSAAIAKDETPGDLLPWDAGVDNDGDTAIDEDPLPDGVDEDSDGTDGEDPAVDVVKAGEPQQVPVQFTLQAGGLADTLDLTIAIAGPSACDPRWTDDSAQVVILGAFQYSTVMLAGNVLAADEAMTFARKYSVRCPAGSHHFNIYGQASSATGMPDPEPNNNQAENELQVVATEDVDGDGVPNAADGCDWTSDAGGMDTDGDGSGDACDMDDDGDSLGVTNGGVAVFGDGRELAIGTDPASACAATPLPNDEPGVDPWPPDFDDNQQVWINDVLQMKRLLEGGPYDARFDLDASGSVNISDVLVIRDFFFMRCGG